MAKEMGVSDVWIGKQCRALNVPAPPPGYWANRAAGGKPNAKYLRPPLTHTVAEHMQENHDNAATGLKGFDAEDFGQVVPPAPATPAWLARRPFGVATQASTPSSRGCSPKMNAGPRRPAGSPGSSRFTEAHTGG